LSIYLFPPAAQAAEPENRFLQLTGEDGQTHWIGYGLDAAENPWPENWELRDGELHAKGGGVDPKTRVEFDDFDLQFQWRIPPGGNSGVMYRVSQETEPAYYTGPEYQIFDAEGFADPVTPDMESAAVYGLYAPNVNAARPPGHWNEGRIVVRNNRVEHYLNDEKVVECELGSDDWKARVAVSKFAEWKKFGTNPRGHIVLQDHGDEVWYRNVRIKRLDDGSDESQTPLCAGSSRVRKHGFKILFGRRR
jgi:hypothetical protein